MSIHVSSRKIVTNNQIKGFRIPIFSAIYSGGIFESDTNAISVRDPAIGGFVSEGVSRKLAALDSTADMSRIIPNDLRTPQRQPQSHAGG